MVDGLVEQEAHAVATVVLDDGVDGLEPLAGLDGLVSGMSIAMGRSVASPCPPDAARQASCTAMAMPEGLSTQPPESQPDDAAGRLRDVTEALEAVAADRALLETLSLEERARLLKAAADVFDPDVAPADGT